MDYQTFKTKLKECNLNLKEFAEICGLNPKSISNWNKNQVPKWVDTWLDNYQKAKTLDNLKTIICEDTPQNP